MPLSRTLALYILEGKATLQDVVDVLVKYDLETLLPFIKQALIQMSSGIHASTTILIESPFNLSDESIRTIKGFIGETEAPHSVILNKNILAGFKAKYKGMVYDGSAERIIKQITN